GPHATPGVSPVSSTPVASPGHPAGGGAVQFRFTASQRARPSASVQVMLRDGERNRALVLANRGSVATSVIATTAAGTAVGGTAAGPGVLPVVGAAGTPATCGTPGGAPTGPAPPAPPPARYSPPAPSAHTSTTAAATSPAGSRGRGRRGARSTPGAAAARAE